MLVLNIDFTKFLVFLSKIFGVLPFNHDEGKSQPQDFFGNILIPVGYIAALIGIYLNNSTILELEDCHSICLTSNTTLLFLGILSYSICVYCSFEKKKFFNEFNRKIHEFDTEFRSIKLKDKIQLEKDYVKITVFIVTVISLILALLWDIRWKFLSYRNDFIRIVLSIFGLIFPFLASALVEAQLIILVEAILKRFQKINFILKLIDKEAAKHAKDYFNSSDDNDTDNEDADDDDDEADDDNNDVNDNDTKDQNDNKEKNKKIENRLNPRHHPKYETRKLNIYNIENSYKIKFNEVNWRARINNIERTQEDGYELFLVLLFKLHNHLNELGTLTNTEYSNQVVIYMTSTFIVSIIGIFLATKVIFTIKGNFTVVDNLAVTFVVWMIFFMVVAYLVLRLCCQAHNESRNTAILVHEILQKKPSFMIRDDNYYIKIKNFTLQYLHWERYFQFNGTGLFSLDYTFIFSILNSNSFKAVSAATSYLIVLLQFDMSSVLEN